MKEKQPTYEATKLKKILGSLDRGELTHGLAVFKDFKNMNREIALCTDKLFGEILETDVQSNEEAKLFLRRLQDSQNKMAIELKQHRLDPKSNEGQLLKKVADKIQFWKFEGEQLWKIASRAARKTVAIIRSITDDWRTMAVPFEADQDADAPRVVEALQLAEKTRTSPEESVTKQEYLQLLKRASEHERALKSKLYEGKSALCRRIQEQLQQAFELAYQRKVEEIAKKNKELSETENYINKLFADFKAFAEKPEIQDMKERQERLATILEKQSPNDLQPPKFEIPSFKRIFQQKKREEDSDSQESQQEAETAAAPPQPREERKSEQAEDSRIVTEVEEEQQPLPIIEAEAKYLLEPKEDTFYIIVHDLLEHKNFELTSSYQVPAHLGFINLRGSALLTGGYKDNQYVREVVEVFPAKGAVEIRENLKRAKTGHSLASLKREKLVFAVGGFNGKQQLKDVELYHTATQKWEWFSPISTKRSNVGVVGVDPWQILYVFGGFSDPKGVLATAERFDYRNPGKGWRKFEVQLDDWHALENPRAAQLAKDRVIVFGGNNSSDTFQLVFGRDGVVTHAELADCYLDAPTAHKRVGRRIFASSANLGVLVLGGRECNWVKNQ